MPIILLTWCLIAGAAAGSIAADSVRCPLTDSSVAADGYTFFYHRHSYGSDLLINPLRLIVNGGFGIMQLDNVDNRVFDVPYGAGLRNVWRNMINPLPAVERLGWRTFLIQEVMPLNFDRETARYWPNYMNHLLGGGMSYRMMTEWFNTHGYPVPWAWSVGTIVFYHMLNEVVENGAYVGDNTDAIADLLIFDSLSMVLFSFESVCRFFSHTLHMNDWSYQTSYDPWRRTIENNGQNFVMKWRLPSSDRWSLFYHWGTHGEFGVARTNERGECWSVGAGLKAGELVVVSPGQKTVDLVMQAGVFYDRNNSLLASVLYSRSKDYALRLNLYPGLIRIGGIHPGVFVGVGKKGRITAGLTIGAARWLPVGIAVSGERSARGA